MSAQRDSEATIATWLAAGPTRLPSTTRRAILASLPTTRQERRGWSAIGRGRSSLAANRLVVVVGLAAVLGLTGVVVLSGGHLPVATPTPAVSPGTSSATVGPSPTLLAPLGFKGTGTIEYTTHDAAGEDDLWLVDPSGANAALFVDGGCCGLFSPDGSLLAAGVPGVTPAGTTRDPTLLGIEVFGPPQGTTTFIVPTGCAACEILGLNYEPDAWSPNGRYLALAFWSDTDPGKSGMGIADRDFAAFAWDWALTRATGNHDDIPIAFSPDSSMLLFMRQERVSGPTSIGALFLLHIADGTVRKITPPGTSVETNGVIQGPASWSPDGTVIAYAGTEADTGETRIFATGPADGSPIRTLVRSAPGATAAHFSPDGAWIAYDRAATGGFHDLILVHPDGSGETNLTMAFGPGACCGQWSPDGRALLVSATASDDFHANLFIVAADGSGIWQVTTSPGPYTAFLWGAGFR
jgi:Tol biopolymer transport system component